MRSGNLNFTQPLVKPQGRGGWGVGFSLNYNSQNWHQSSSQTWLDGQDVGYGFGWKLLAGSLTPIYSNYWTINFYLFTDSTGAEYKLDQNSGGVFSSKESIYVWYDSNAGRLYFKDGSFWVFGCQSGGTEQDAGSLYPTTMQDTNGNQILVRYASGVASPWANSSARISQIEDVRSYNTGGATYFFAYNTDPVPHLTSITNNVGTGEAYNFAYQANYSLNSPFGGTYGTTTTLTSLTQATTSLATGFTYDSGGTGELTQVTAPYGGHLRWTYANDTLTGGIVRQVQFRYVAASSGAAENQHQVVRYDSGVPVHGITGLYDSGGKAARVWWMQTDTSQPNAGLMTAYDERSWGLSTDVVYKRDDYAWSQNASGNEYISQVTTTLDPGQSYQKQKSTVQTVDSYGNLATAVRL